MNYLHPPGVGKIDLENYVEYTDWVLDLANSTKTHNKTALKQYCEFTGMNPEELVDQAEEDRNSPRRKRSKTERMLKEFLNHLQDGNLADTSVKSKFARIKSFYSDNGFPQDKPKIPKANARNREEKLRKRDVRKLVDHAPTIRDKAIILMGFQAGMDVSTVCSLNYGDVADELEDDRQPLMIEPERPKSKVQYKTFLARDGIEKLKAYLRHRRQKFGEIGWNDPLFVKEQRRKKDGELQEPERIEPHNIHKLMREIAVESGVVKKEKMESAKMNPCRFHTLRKGFSSILQLEGVNQDIIDGMMGHSIDYNGAYSQLTDEELRRIYNSASSELSISEIPDFAKDQEERISHLEKTIGDQREKIEKRKEEIEELKQSVPTDLPKKPNHIALKPEELEEKYGKSCREAGGELKADELGRTFCILPVETERTEEGTVEVKIKF